MSERRPGIVLAMTVHDPERRLYRLTAEHLPRLRTLYDDIFALCSPTTDAETAALLRREGVTVEYQQNEAGSAALGSVRLATVKSAFRFGYSHCHLCDHDRILHWLMAYPDELVQVIARIPEYDFLVLGRTDRAFATHPPAQQETERLVTHVFGLAFGQPWDITAGARGLSWRAGETLCKYAREDSVGNDAEWPLILKRFPELRLGYLATEGLEFETADRYREEIAQIGDIQKWISSHYDTMPSWEFRISTAQQIICATQRASQPDYLSRS